MEEIEYLEEYEDLILPAISDNASTANTEQNLKNSNSNTLNVNAGRVDDEDSSSIDQDIFESLFDDNSDDDTMLSKKVDSKIGQRREDRVSMDSLDMLVKDLGEQLSSNVVSTTNSTIESPATKSNTIHNKTISKGISSSPMSKSYSKLTYSMKSKQIIEKTKSELGNSSKPKSVATVRPTIQNQQQKRLLLTKTGNVSSLSSSTTTTTTSVASSSSGRLPLANRAKSSTAGSMPTTSTSSTVSKSSKLSNVDHTKGTVAQKKSMSRPQPTIIKPEKLSSNKDPAEDPLSLEDIGGGLTSDSDSSFVYSDISDDSFASLSDLNDTDEYIDGDNSKASLVAAKANLVSSSVERVNKNQGSVTTTQNDKNSLMSETKQSESVCSSSAVSSIAATNRSTTKMSDGTKKKNDLKDKGKDSIEQSTIVPNDKSNVASSVLEITKNLPERVTIISDTILNRMDTEFMRTITATDNQKDNVETNSSKTLSTTEKETKAVDRKETLESVESAVDATVSVSLSNSNEEEEIRRMSPDLENVANTEEVLMNKISSGDEWDEAKNDLAIQTKNVQKNKDLQKELCVNDKNTKEQKNMDNKSDDFVEKVNEDVSVDESNKNTQEIQADLKEEFDNKENEKTLDEKSNEVKSDSENIIEKECADNVQSASDEIESTERNTAETKSLNDDEETKISEVKNGNNVEDIKGSENDISQSDTIKEVRNHSEEKTMEKPSETETLKDCDNLSVNTEKAEQEKEEGLQEVSESISEASKNANTGVPVSPEETEKNVCTESTEKGEGVITNKTNSIQDEEKTENAQSSQVCQGNIKDKNTEVEPKKVTERKEISKKTNKKGRKNLKGKLKNNDQKIKLKDGKSATSDEQNRNVEEKNADGKTEINEMNQCSKQSANEEANDKTAFPEMANNEKPNSTSKSGKDIMNGKTESPNEFVTSTQKACEVTEKVDEKEHKQDMGNGSDDHTRETNAVTERASGAEEAIMKPRFILRRRNQIIDNDISEKNADGKTPLRAVVEEIKIKKATADTSKDSVENSAKKEVIEDIKTTIEDNANLNDNKSSEKKTIDLPQTGASDDDKSPHDKMPNDLTELSRDELSSDVNVAIMNTALVKYTIESVDKHENETHEKAHGDVETFTRRSLRKRNAESPLLSNDNTKAANRTSTASTNAIQNVKHDTQTSAKMNAQVIDEEILKKYLNLTAELKRKLVCPRKSEDTTESETDESKKLKIDTSATLDKNKESDKVSEALDMGKDNVPGRTTKARILNATDKGKAEGEPPYKIPRLSSNVKETSVTDNISITETKKQVANDSVETSNCTLNNSRDERKKDERNYIRKTAQKLTSFKYGKPVKGAEENKSVSESKSPNKSHMSTRASPNKPAGTVMTFNEWLKRQNVNPQTDDILSNSETDEVNDRKNLPDSEITEHDKSNEIDKSTTVNENQNTRPKSTRRILLLPKSDRTKETLHKITSMKISSQVSPNTEAPSKSANQNAETISQVELATKNITATDEKAPEPDYEKTKKKKAKTATKAAGLTAPIKSTFKMPQEPAANRRSFTTKKSHNDEHRQPKNMNSAKIQKCRKLRVCINRSVVAAYFRNFELKSKSKIITDSLNQKPNPKAPITLVTPIHLTRASSKTPVALHHSEPKTSDANQVTDSTPSTDSQSRHSLNNAQREHVTPSLDHSTDDTVSSLNNNLPAALHASLPSNTRSKSAKSEIRLRVPIAGRANVLTIPPQNRRPAPMSTRQTQQTQQTANSNKPDKDQEAKDVETGLLRNNLGSQPYLTRSHRKPVPMQLNASVQSERSVTNKSSQHLFDVSKMSANVTAKESSVVSQNVVEANEQTTALTAELNATAESATVPEVKEEMDELTNISLPTESANVPANIFGANAFVSHISNGTMFGVTPTALDANGTRLYSFLHPAKYSRSHGMVVLDYCCPNLDGPMSAIDPTRIHAQIQAPVRELPAYIVMTTKLITRADLEANNTAIPALIRQKVEKITATNSKTQTVTKASVTTAPTNAAKQKTQTALPQTVSVLQKHLPSTTAIPVKSLPPALRTFNAAAGGAMNAISAGLPALTPFSVFSQTQAANMVNSALTEGQRNLLRSNLRRFDSLLKKYYHRIALLSLPNRQLIIESIIRDNMNNGASESLQPKDVEHAVRVLEAYIKHMDSITSTPDIVVTSASDMPPSEMMNPGSGNVTNRKKTMGNPNTSATSTPNSKMHAPIFDSERNIIGWQLKVATTSTATATTSTSGNIHTRSVMSTRSESLFSTSASAAGTPGLMASKRMAPSQQLSRLSGGQQDSSRLFYSKTSMQTSTPIAGNPTANTTNSPATPINSIRGGRGITLKQIKKHANTPASGSMLTAESSAPATTFTAPATTYATAQSTSQASRGSITSKPCSIRVTRQRAAAVDVSAIKAAGSKTSNANTGAASKKVLPPKILVINKDNSGNNLPTPDECILPDNTDARDGQNVANAVIKHEQMDDDFIGGH